MKNKRYLLLVSAAAWMVIVWMLFSERPTIAMLLSAIYCSVAAWLMCLAIAGDYGRRRRILEEKKTEERYRKLADALHMAEMDTENKVKTQSCIEANRKWKLEKAGKQQTA